MRREIKEKIVLSIAKLLGVDLRRCFYYKYGILKYRSMIESGEQFFIDKILKKYIKKFPQKKYVVFDVGANVGNFSLALQKKEYSLDIHAFEPNPDTYELLKVIKNIKSYKIGFSNKVSHEKLYYYDSDTSTEHASLYVEAIEQIHGSKSQASCEVKLSEIDIFCKESNIDKIDLLKIDTEGNEYKVLEGASHYIKEDKIKMILFEFNEMNVISRVFLKDFYNLLKNYSLHRLDSDRLIKLGAYDTVNEIFKFQNILAINNSIGEFYE